LLSCRGSTRDASVFGNAKKHNALAAGGTGCWTAIGTTGTATAAAVAAKD
jgi:hypothetical protein